jgi:hypothetical protein
MSEEVYTLNTLCSERRTELVATTIQPVLSRPQQFAARQPIRHRNKSPGGKFVFLAHTVQLINAGEASRSTFREPSFIAKVENGNGDRATASHSRTEHRVPVLESGRHRILGGFRTLHRWTTVKFERIEPAKGASTPTSGRRPATAVRAFGRRSKHVVAKAVVFGVSALAGWWFAYLVVHLHGAFETLKDLFAPIGQVFDNIAQILNRLFR